MNHTTKSKQVIGRPQSGQWIDMKSKDQIQRHVPSPASSDDGKALTPHEMKRRAQNRASQRAFRERKRTQAEELQRQVHQMQKRHDELLQSYHDKEEEVSTLYENIRRLQARFQALDTSIPEPQAFLSSTSFQFEPVTLDDPFDRWSSAVFQAPAGWDAQSQDPNNISTTANSSRFDVDNPRRVRCASAPMIPSTCTTPRHSLLMKMRSSATVVRMSVPDYGAMLNFNIKPLLQSALGISQPQRDELSPPHPPHAPQQRYS